MKTERQTICGNPFTLRILNDARDLIGFLAVVPAHASQIDRFEQLLNDRPGCQGGELRQAFKPLALEMIRQKIDAFKCDRIQSQFFASIWKEGAKAWEEF